MGTLHCTTGGIFETIRRLGVPYHFITILICIRERALINMNHCDDDSDVESSIGVRLDVLVRCASRNGDLDLAGSIIFFSHPFQRF